MYYSIIIPHFKQAISRKEGEYFFMKKFQFTPDGFKKLELEYADLLKTKRPAAVSRLAKARSMGDLSENSEYSAAKEGLAFVEGRIKEVEELMKNAQVIDAKLTDGIEIGSEVTVEKDGNHETYYIVGEFEADPMAKKLRALGIDPYTPYAKKDHENIVIKGDFDKYNGKEVTLTGRLIAKREHGKLIFGDIQDQSGSIQIGIKKDEIQEDLKNSFLGWDKLSLIDTGDFIQVTGTVNKTQQGEVTIFVKHFKLLTKSLRPHQIGRAH